MCYNGLDTIDLDNPNLFNNIQENKNMKIVICDDNIEDLVKIEKLLHKYINLHTNIKFETKKYSDPLKLCRQIQEKDLADIYLLDMIMSEKTGIDIGRQLQRSGCESVIIYITSSADFALDAYSLHAARYLLKPIRETELFEALDYALSLRDIKNGPVYLVKTKDGLVPAPHSKIEYVENVSRTLEIHLTNGEVVKSIFIRKSFDQEIKELLCDKNFLQVHKSYVINLKYIKKLLPDSVLTESGSTIPVSKKRTAEVKREYLFYYSEQYR